MKPGQKGTTSHKKKRRRSSKRTPSVFISHDSRDARLAEEFATLLERASGEKITTFRSSDRKGTTGIPYGKDWFNTILKEIDRSSDVVCILTLRSLDRPWIFWEAGIAKGMGKTVHGLAIGLSMDDACEGPFKHFQNCKDDQDELTGLINTIFTRHKIKQNDYLISTAVGDFLEAKKKVLLESDPPVVEKYLRPDPGTMATLQDMKRNLFAVDGMIEICRSIDYSGWSRKEMAPFKIVQQRALPEEFLKYRGKDASCKTGSQARFSLKSITEPLHDEGTIKIYTVLAESKYDDVFKLSRLLDKPFHKKDNKIWSGRSLYGSSWYPLENSPLIHNVNTQPVIITKDKRVILVKRSSRVHHYPGCWSASIEEQMIAPGDCRSLPDQTFFDCAERGVREELGCTPDQQRTKILSVGVEFGNLSASFICVVYIEETYKEASEKWGHKAIDPYEASAIDCISLKKTSIMRVLKKRDYNPSRSICIRNQGDPADWHPTARMRLYALACHLDKEL